MNGKKGKGFLRKKRCNHLLKYRQAVASTNQRYGDTQVVVVCVNCGKVLFHKVVEGRI